MWKQHAVEQTSEDVVLLTMANKAKRKEKTRISCMPQGTNKVAVYIHFCLSISVEVH